MAFRYQLLLPRPSLVRGMARARRVSPNWCPYRHPGRCIYNGSPWWKWSAGRSYSWLLQQWHTLRKTVGVAPLSRVRRPSPPAPLLLWGAVAFVWDRERITTDEIVSRLKEYEVMVMSKVKSPRQSEAGISKLDTATTAHQDEDSHSEQSFEQELSCRSSLEEERESKRQRFIQEARLFYEQHTRESISDLPLVGLKHESRVYDWSYKVIDVCRGLRLLAIEQVSQFSLVQYLNRSLTDGSLRTAICSEATSFAADGSVEGGTLDLALEDFERPSDAVPLVGMRPKSDPSSKLLEKFFKAAWNFCRAMSDSHSNLTIGTFDNVLGVDGSTLQQTTLSSQGEGLTGQPSESGATKTGETAINHGHTRATIISRSESHVDLREEKATEINHMQNLECTELATQSRSEVDQPPAESVKHPTVLQSAVEALPSSDGVVSEGDLQARDDIGGVTEENDDDLAGWELLTKQETCVAYRKPYKDTGLFQYKVIGTYHDVTPKDFLDVQVEYEARKSWDNYLVKLETVDYDPRSGSEVIHWIFKFPFPMSSREYVFVRRSWVSANEDSIVLINRSVEHPKVPKRRSYVRVRDYYSTIVIKAHTFIDELGLDYELTYFDDPQISLPSSCINWVTTTAMPDFTSKIHVAARRRASYSQKKQMEDDNLAGWELLTKQETCVAYRKPYKDTGLFQYKVIGTYHDVTPKDFLDVQVEYEARKSWDNYLVKLETVDYDPRSGSEVIHWIFKFPFPMSSREYVFVRRSWVSANEDSIVLINRSVEHPKVPERRNYVRVRDYYSTIVIKAHTFIDELGLDYELTYFDDPQISLPSSCINWVTTTAMPDFTSKIHVAARRRASYSQKKQMEGV